MSNEELITKIFQKLPYSDQITDLKIEGECIYFSWRGHTFCVGNSLMSVNEVDRGCSVGSDLAMLLKALLKT